MKNIAIIGGGSAGLFLAKQLSKYNTINTYIFERNSKLATKLKASGGGKANIFNMQISPECYNNKLFIKNLLQKFNAYHLKQEFESFGLQMKIDEEHRVYPITEFSQTVVDVLVNNIQKNTKIIYQYNVNNIKSINQKWQINDFETLFDIVILASGTPAGMIKANRDKYNNYLFDLKLNTSKYRPSLCGFKIKNYPKMLFGCRTKSIVHLYKDNQLLFKEKGEITFKEDGISGIVILNASAYYNRLKDKQNCSIVLNLVHHDENYNVSAHLQKYNTLLGILHPKLNELYQKKAFNIQKFELQIDNTYDFDYAQVCSGGISTEEITPYFEIKKYKNLYSIGEMLDIDGICGGYNLFFAFASAYLTAKHILNGN